MGCAKPTLTVTSEPLRPPPALVAPFAPEPVLEGNNNLALMDLVLETRAALDECRARHGALAAWLLGAPTTKEPVP